jgi:PPOX class probable F420-dependent enzyme
VSIRLTREEAWAAIGAAHTGIFVSLRADGFPVALPVWFVVLDEHVYVASPARASKVARVRRDPRVAFLVESGTRWAELRAVHLTGRARVVREHDLVERVLQALTAKYAQFRTDRSAMPDATREHYEADTRAVIEIVPDERVLTWDNARLRLGD